MSHVTNRVQMYRTIIINGTQRLSGVGSMPGVGHIVFLGSEAQKVPNLKYSFKLTINEGCLASNHEICREHHPTSTTPQKTLRINL